NGCPQCPAPRNARAAREKAGREAIRFVRACAAGHLDDADWNYIVHAGPACAGQPGYYLWTGGGGSLRNVEICCPPSQAGGCGRPAPLGGAYARDWRGPGRFPGRGARPAKPSCNPPAKITQRGPTNPRTQEIIPPQTTPPISSRLHTILQDSRLMTLCSML